MVSVASVYAVMHILTAVGMCSPVTKDGGWCMLEKIQIVIQLGHAVNMHVCTY